jgi:MFS-type transporter involved in bile tolerance (Atg22 family)
MKRFLIFSILFPPLALVMFSAPDVILHHDFKLLDLVTLSLTYTFAVIPALILAWLDQKFRLVGTMIAGAAIAYLAAFIIGFPFLDYRATLMVGLVGGVPAAVCSWLSDKSMKT